MITIDSIYALLLACVGSSGVASVVLACLNRRWAKKDSKNGKLDAVVEGVKVLTIDRVRYLGKCYIIDQQISLEDKENLDEMYRAYKALGGNGHLDTIMAEVGRLKVKGEADE